MVILDVNTPILIGSLHQHRHNHHHLHHRRLETERGAVQLNIQKLLLSSWRRGHGWCKAPSAVYRVASLCFNDPLTVGSNPRSDPSTILSVSAPVLLKFINVVNMHKLQRTSSQRVGELALTQL